jgi:hypothetical protein
MITVKVPYSDKTIEVPDTKKVTGKICFITNLTLTNCDLDSDIHKGFTIGKGKTMYWMMIWHSSGNVTAYSIDTLGKRYLSGDAEITVHFK